MLTQLPCPRHGKSYKLTKTRYFMADDSNTLPAGFGGLVRFKEEYDSKLKFGPGAVVAMIIVVVVFVAALHLFF